MLLVRLCFRCSVDCLKILHSSHICIILSNADCKSCVGQKIKLKSILWPLKVDVFIQEIQIVVIVLANDFPKLLAVPLLAHLALAPLPSASLPV